MARDLGRLADELAGYAGQDARAALLYWQSELLAAADDLQKMTARERLAATDRA